MNGKWRRIFGNTDVLLENSMATFSLTVVAPIRGYHVYKEI